MPVQSETISATESASRGRGPSALRRLAASAPQIRIRALLGGDFLLDGRNLAVVDARTPSPDRLRGDTFACARRSSSFLRRSPTWLWPFFSASQRAFRPLSFSLCRRFPACRSSRRSLALSFRFGLLPSLHSLDSPRRSPGAAVHRFPQARSRVPCAGALRPHRPGRWPCPAADGRKCSGSRGLRRRPARRRRWSPCGGPRTSSRPRRMAMVSSTLGSPTNTCWKRRSSAGSFSMFSRYSSSVVAPIRRSSPRASMGFSILPASMEPSAAPAPTMVWISSMKGMICRRPS